MVVKSTDITRFKMILMEQSCPFFEENEIRFMLQEATSFNQAIYKACLIKASNGNFEIQGLSVDETYDMYMRLANEYRPNNSRLLRM